MGNPIESKLSPGLYLIATPIGAARDITLRALDILASADMLVAEDTRSLRKLMEIHGIATGARPVLSYHDHNGDRVRPRILEALDRGQAVVYASEAGTPMVADPGFDLGRAAVAAGHALVSAPGPSAVITALTLAGLPTDAFHFSGFLPSTTTRRKSALADLAAIPGTLVLYESPKRVAACLADAAEVLGGARQAAVARELTKKFEEVLRGTLSDLAARCAERPPRGECVILIDRARVDAATPADVEARLRSALRTLSVRDAADRVSAELGMKRRQVYQMALRLEADA